MNIYHPLKLGILGCGAIGSRIALSTKKELKGLCRVSGVHDIHLEKAQDLAKKLKGMKLVKETFPSLIMGSDLIVEATGASDVRRLIGLALQRKKHVLCMSVGKIIDPRQLVRLAKMNNCRLMIPSGAIGGIDAFKAASLVGVEEIVLTTKKSPNSLEQTDYLKNKKIFLSRIKKNTIIFEGNVEEAVKYFPKNINVAATLALATQAKEKIKIVIMACPNLKNNIHEIKMSGEQGSILCRSENRICPDNPKTSYLAVLSAIQTIKDFCTGCKVGT